MVMRGRHRQHKVTHCLQGHPYSAGNVYFNPAGFRQCRICQRAASRAHKERVRRSSGSKPHLAAEQIRAIRAEYAAGGVPQRVLAAKYNVTQPTISRVVNLEEQ
jgi:hypothetical protein